MSEYVVWMVWEQPCNLAGGRPAQAGAGASAHTHRGVCHRQLPGREGSAALPRSGPWVSLCGGCRHGREGAGPCSGDAGSAYLLSSALAQAPAPAGGGGKGCGDIARRPASRRSAPPGSTDARPGPGQLRRGYWWSLPQRGSVWLLGPQKVPRGEITARLCGRASHLSMAPLDAPGRREGVQSWVGVQVLRLSRAAYSPQASPCALVSPM